MTWHASAAVDPAIGPVTINGREVGRARGYSPLELERAGISEDIARRLGLPLDPERCTSIGCNVMQLRQLLTHNSLIVE